jgi:hypothetical protein
MIDGLSPMLAGDRTSASATLHKRQYRMLRQPIATQSDGICMAVVAERYRIACRTILRHAKPRQTNPYREYWLRGGCRDEMTAHLAPVRRRQDIPFNTRWSIDTRHTTRLVWQQGLDHPGKIRGRNQPVTRMKAENSSPTWPKDGYHSTVPETLIGNGAEIGGADTV